MVEVTVKTANFLLNSKRFVILPQGVLAEVKRKETAENDFEAKQKDGFPLNCNLPDSTSYHAEV